MIPMADKTSFVNNDAFLELEIVDPPERVYEGAICWTRNQVMRLGVKLRMHLGDHRLPEVWCTMVAHRLWVVTRNIERYPPVIELEMLDLGVESLRSGEDVHVAESEIVRERDAPEHDARQTILVILEVFANMRVGRSLLDKSRSRKTLGGRGARSTTARLMSGLVACAWKLQDVGSSLAG